MDIVKRQGKVLIIETNPSFRAALSAYLSSNYAVYEAGDVAAGLNRIAQFQPDIILLDKRLLDSDAAEVLGKLRAQSSVATAIILLSGQVNVDDAVAAIKMGAADFISKPVDPNKLVKIIEQNLEQVKLKKRFQDLPFKLESKREEAPWCFSGNLENTSISDLLQFLSLSHMTGTLEVHCGLLSTTIFFIDGEIISAGSSNPREYLGHFLISRGIIDENKLAELVRKQDEEKILLGKLIIHEGIADEKIVSEILIEKITDTVTNLFLQKKGMFTFYQNFLIPYMFHTVKVPVMGLIMEGEVKREQWEKIWKVVPSVSATVELKCSAAELPENGSWNPFLLPFLDGAHSIEEICLETHSSEWSVLSQLYPLYEKGFIAFKTEGFKTSGSTWGTVLVEQAVEKARRMLVGGDSEGALRLLYEVCEQPDCNWNLVMPLLEDAERQFVNWFYAYRVSPTDIPYVRYGSSTRAMSFRSTQSFLFNRINGVRDVKSLVDISPLREVEVLLALQHFLELRIIGIRKPGTPVETLERTGEHPFSLLPPAVIDQMFRDLPLGVLIASPAGLITYANEHFLKISGLKHDQVEGLNISDIFVDQHLEQIHDSYEREYMWSGLFGKLAIRRYWLYSVFPFSDQNEQEKGMTIIIRDVTDIHRKELNDKRKDRLTSLGEFVAGMTHQLKNPVMLLESAVRWLLEENLSREEVEEVAIRMQKNVERLRNLISDTLNYVSMDESTFGWIDLNRLIESCMPVLQEHIGSRKIRLEFHPMENPPLIRGNETQVREVVINLGLNGLQSMEEEGRLQIITDLQDELEGGILRKYLLMVISDTGKGMPAPIVEKLFTPFFTTKPSGKGLGLAFAKRIVEEQGGFIRCWSKEGIGTHFYVYFRIGEKNAFDLTRG